MIPGVGVSDGREGSVSPGGMLGGRVGARGLVISGYWMYPNP